MSIRVKEIRQRARQVHANSTGARQLAPAAKLTLLLCAEELAGVYQAQMRQLVRRKVEEIIGVPCCSLFDAGSSNDGRLRLSL